MVILFSHHNAHFFLNKKCKFERKKNISFNFNVNSQKKHAHFVGKNKGQLFKKNTKYKTLKSTQKLMFL